MPSPHKRRGLDTIRKEGTSDSDDKFLNKSQDLSQKTFLLKFPFNFLHHVKGKRNNAPQLVIGRQSQLMSKEYYNIPKI